MQGTSGSTGEEVPLPNSIHLGQIADFWKRYDTIADSYDNRITKHLNENLDVLLIYAGLFSGINTAFIGMVMPPLSPDSTAETNALLRLLISGADTAALAAYDQQNQNFTPEFSAVAINCLFYVSLSFSSFAAVCAMMCKEWLHSLDRTGQTGAIEDQGRIRQRKFDGARKWQLEMIMDFLPTIILASITLFSVGIVIFLLTLNKTVAIFVIVFGTWGASMVSGTILASAIFPLCPYETATSRTLRKIFHIMGTWRKKLRDVEPGAAPGQIVKGASRSVASLFGRGRGALARAFSPREEERTLPVHNQSNRSFSLTSNEKYVEKEERKELKQQIVNSQAALWLLEMAPSREDQLIAVRFLCTAPREACAVVIISSQRRQLLISLTLEAFAFWRSQPTEQTQENAEHFGRALCHVLPHSWETAERWRELNPRTPQIRRIGFGERFLREVGSSEQTPNLPDLVGEEYTLQSALLRTLILTKDIPFETYRWTQLKFLIKKEDENAQLLGLWAKLVCKGFGHSEKHQLRRFPSASAAVSRKGRETTKRDVADSDFPLALAYGVAALKTVERQATPDNVASMVLDAVEIYTACVQKTVQLVEADRLLPAFRELVADALTGMMMYFKKSAFLNPPEPPLLDFIVSALQLLRALHDSGYSPSLEDAAFDGLWYALDSIITSIDSSTEIDRMAMDDLVIQTLESLTEWLPVKYGAYAPMVGLEDHPLIIEYITSHLVAEFQKSEGRAVHLTYRNRSRWFTQASGALRTAWVDARLSSHLVDAVRRPDNWKDTALVVQILEDITDMSTEWCCRLVADGFLDSVADVILNFEQMEEGNPVRRRYIQARLTRALLSVWRHCSTIPDIKWPMDKMLAVINCASSATELLLGRHATPMGPGARALPNVALGKDALIDIRNKLKLFFDWINERLSNPGAISRDTTPAISTLLTQRMDGESPPTSRFQLPRTCSRGSYVENSLL